MAAVTGASTGGSRCRWLMPRASVAPPTATSARDGTTIRAIGALAMGFLTVDRLLSFGDSCDENAAPNGRGQQDQSRCRCLNALHRAPALSSQPQWVTY